jgi:hypothetical protein
MSVKKFKFSFHLSQKSVTHKEMNERLEAL